MKKTKVMVVIALFTGILATGCLKENNNDTPIPAPAGKFDGKFVVIKKRTTGGVVRYDTTKTPLKLNLTTDSKYVVSGDTTGTHAASHGNFAYNYYYIQFTDETLPDSSSKRHLNGTYQYYYDGLLLQIGAANDTMKVVYDLKKTAE
ncbi:MAG: hypothetical protein ABIP28_04315 [Mucilaginibacter sp.]